MKKQSYSLDEKIAYYTYTIEKSKRRLQELIDEKNGHEPKHQDWKSRTQEDLNEKLATARSAKAKKA